MKKFIANATNNPGNKGVTNKVLEFINFEGNAVLESNEITPNQVLQIAADHSIDVQVMKKYKKEIRFV